MQAQQQKPAKKPSLNVGEAVIAVVNLLIAAVGAWVAFDLLIHLADTIAYGFAGVPAAVGALGAGLTGLLIFLRQRRLAVFAQWLATTGMLAFFGFITWTALKNRGTLPMTWAEALTFLPLLAITLLFAWFATFLKRLNDSDV